MAALIYACSGAGTGPGSLAPANLMQKLDLHNTAENRSLRRSQGIIV